MSRSISLSKALVPDSRTLNYRMPAEWEPHKATWLAWPHNHDDWPGKFGPIPWVYAEMIRNLARHERVELIVEGAAAERKARKQLERANAPLKNVRFHRWRTDRVWLRDSGCVFVMSGADTLVRGKARPNSALSAIKFRFNAWAKYSNWHKDEKIGSLMAAAARAKEIHALCGNTRVVLEGGSIDVNGYGTLLTTEECLLSEVQQRNPGFSRKDYERFFADHLGAQNVIWLGKGIAGDDTHGHVDDLARFVSPDTVMTMVEGNRKDANYKALRENRERLMAARDQAGKRLNVVEVPMPRPVVFEGRRLPASYANFYIANEVVLVPVFNDANDRIALDTFAALFPKREIVPIYCGDLVWGFGTMHCMTQQQPSSNLSLP
ncbi:MAG: agmatine deiminase family protein [Candidatus Sulfotelmatobacter sp.]